MGCTTTELRSSLSSTFHIKCLCDLFEDHLLDTGPESPCICFLSVLLGFLFILFHSFVPSCFQGNSSFAKTDKIVCRLVQNASTQLTNHLVHSATNQTLNGPSFGAKEEIFKKLLMAAYFIRNNMSHFWMMPYPGNTCKQHLEWQLTSHPPGMSDAQQLQCSQGQYRLGGPHSFSGEECHSQWGSFPMQGCHHFTTDFCLNFYILSERFQFEASNLAPASWIPFFYTSENCSHCCGISRKMKRKKEVKVKNRVWKPKLVVWNGQNHKTLQGKWSTKTDGQKTQKSVEVHRRTSKWRDQQSTANCQSSATNHAFTFFFLFFFAKKSTQCKGVTFFKFDIFDEPKLVWVQCNSASAIVRSLTCSNFQPSDIVDTIWVSSSSEHCNTRYTFFTWFWKHRKPKTDNFPISFESSLTGKNANFGLFFFFFFFFEKKRENSSGLPMMRNSTI